MFQHRASRRRLRSRAFTLVELLVVIGIIAVLIAVLMPALRKARAASINTVCASRLHQIDLACTAYLAEFKTFPVNYVNDKYDFVFPHDQQSRMLNLLMTYLNFAEIKDSTPIGDFPAVLQCPWAEMSDSQNRETIGNGNTYWYTGYAYFGRLDEKVNYIDRGPPVVVHMQQGVPLKPERIADGKGRHRGVLWGDNVVYFGPFTMWNYTHFKNARIGAAPIAGFDFWRNSSNGLAGRHLAWSDGSVEWVNGSEMNLDVSGTKPEQNASYKTRLCLKTAI